MHADSVAITGQVSGLAKVLYNRGACNVQVSISSGPAADQGIPCTCASACWPAAELPAMVFRTSNLEGLQAASLHVWDSLLNSSSAVPRCIHRASLGPSSTGLARRAPSTCPRTVWTGRAASGWTAPSTARVGPSPCLCLAQYACACGDILHALHACRLQIPMPW